MRLTTDSRDKMVSGRHDTVNEISVCFIARPQIRYLVSAYGGAAAPAALLVRPSTEDPDIQDVSSVYGSVTACHGFVFIALLSLTAP